MINRHKLSRCVTVLLLLFCFINFRKYVNMPWLILDYYDILKNSKDMQICTLPQVDPFDPSIKSYISKPERLRCKQIQPNFVFMDDAGVLQMNQTVVESSGFDNLVCSYRCFSHNDGIDDDNLKYEEWSTFKTSVYVKCEFVEVTCKRLFLTVYSYVFTNVQKLLGSDSIGRKDRKNSDQNMNVVIIGIDSMSRSNMVRQMPKSLKFLEDKLDAVTFDGFTKVGDNTWVNLLAMVTGLRSFPTDEFPADLPQTETIFFDNYAQYIWKNFSRSGYATFYAEDRPDVQNFNYGIRKGFKFLPTDHYDRPMWLAMWWSFVHMRSSAFCYNTVADHNFMFDYLRKFLKAYRNDKSFALLWWQNLSHDFLNYIGSADDDFVEFLRSLQIYLNNTVLFIVSDHGHRFDAIRQTVVGRLEARMPFMSIVTPTWFRSKYPNAYQSLIANSRRRLTTPFDVYATLSDILHGTIEKVKSRKVTKHSPSYALSLFDRIFPERNCKDARIPEEYCPCYQEFASSINDEKVQQASVVLISHINHLLDSNQPPCAVLQLHAIKGANIFLPHQGTLNDVQVGKRIPKGGFYVSYRIVIETQPGGALLEGIVKHYLDDDNFVVEGDVDRNNKYGNSSYCIANIVLKKYCYCIGR